MTGLTSSISLSSNALILLGGNSISSFDDGSSEATIAANLYETTYLGLLTEHRWRFATKKASLAKLAAAPSNGYANAFQIPSDCIYFIKTEVAQDYEIYGTELHSNHNTVEADYIYRVDEDKLPPYFSSMIEFFLASKFAVPLTGDLNKADFYLKAYNNQLKKAKHADSTQRPVDTFRHNPYVDVRY